MPSRPLVAATGAALLAGALIGCGGGGGAAPAGAGGAGSEPIVAAIRTDSLKFGLPSTFVASGSNLDETVTLQTGGVVCTSPRADRISSTELRVVCTPEDVGPLQITLVRQGVTLKTHADEVVKPRVQVLIGSGATARQIELTIEPGSRGGVQRGWANNFLHYVNSGFYNGTFFHGLFENTVVDGGCYARDPNSTPSLNRKSATVFAPAPLAPLTIEGGMRNVQYTVAISQVPCTGAQFSSFSLNLLDNSTGKLTDRDAAKFVAIGSFNGADAATRQQLIDLSRLTRRIQTNPQEAWLPNAPNDLAAGTIQSMTQTR
jgi:hypothetical protein